MTGAAGSGDPGDYPGTPRWVKAFGIVLIVLVVLVVLLFVILHLLGVSPRPHTP